MFESAFLQSDLQAETERFRGIPCEEKGGWVGVEEVMRGMAIKEVKKGNTYLYILLDTEQETKNRME